MTALTSKGRLAVFGTGPPSSGCHTDSVLVLGGVFGIERHATSPTATAARHAKTAHVLRREPSLLRCPVELCSDMLRASLFRHGAEYRGRFGHRRTRFASPCDSPCPFRCGGRFAAVRKAPKSRFEIQPVRVDVSCYIRPAFPPLLRQFPAGSVPGLPETALKRAPWRRSTRSMTKTSPLGVRARPRFEPSAQERQTESAGASRDE